MKKLLSVIFLLFPIIVCSQNKYTLSGYVKDSLSGETLIGSTISVAGLSKGITSNSYGFFSISLTTGTYTFVCSNVGYATQIKKIDLTGDVAFNFEMSPKITTEQTVIISSRKRDANVKNAQMGKIDLSINQIKAIPAFLGEVDVLKTIQLLPGVQSAGEGSSGLYVRGGGPDQNLILLDDAVVYNTGHLFGFFSIFNGDAIKNTSLIKGGMPAQYGGRLSSVLDIAMKEGNDKNFQVEGGIGLIASRFSIQGPVKKNKASFIISARRTYVDALVKPFIKKTNSFSGSGYYFYDLNAKINYKISEKDHIYLSGYFGKDKFDFVNGKQSLNVHIPWGNATGTFRWNHVLNNRLFSNTTLVYNDYNFNFGANQNNFEINLKSGIKDWNIKQDFDLYPFTNHKIKFGALYTYHTFTPSVLTGKQDSVEFMPNNAQQKYSHEGAVYVQDDWDISDKIKINAGIRESVFQQVGKYKIYTTDANGNRLDSTVYKKGEPVKTYFAFEPRFTIRYALDDATSIKASVTRNAQYIHLVSNAGTTLPTDIWVPSTLKVKPQISWLYALGLFKNFNDNTYETSLEVYYKDLQNQIEYEEGYTPATLEDTENFFTFGRGKSYGTELFINKTKGRLTGWLGYTLSWTFRKFPGLNSGEQYPAKYDRRHDISLVGIYELSKKWKLSGTFVYGSGNAATLPQRFYIYDGVLTQQYSRINEYRLPSYHRLDVAATYSPKKHPERKLKSEWVFSVYNIYSRKNPYFIYFDQTGNPYNGTLEVQAKQVSLFPVIPSVTWNFKF
ncbi:MAG: TonB-dependent receptor [Ginsengibacter sp.]